jgi:hypothetical protein
MDSGLVLAISAFIAVILILSGIIGILLKMEKKLGVFSLAIFFLILTIAILFLDSLFPGVSEIPTIQILLQFRGLLFAILAFIFAFLAIWNLRQTYSQNSKPCNAISVPVAMYEPFANGMSERTTLLRLIRQANQVLEQIQNGSEDVNMMVSDACTLLNEVKQNYIDANASQNQQPEAYTECLTRNGDEEACKNLKLSSEAMEKQNATRKARATRLYESEKARLQTGPMIECFENSEIAELEDELRIILTDIEPFIQASEQEKLMRQCKNIRNTMAFVLALTKKGQTQINKADEKIEGFLDLGSGVTLIDRAKKILSTAQTLLNEILLTKTEFSKAKSEYDSLQGKVNRMASGEPTQEDILKGPRPEQGSCPSYMFQYAKDAGGYCCADEPTEYNSERGEYLQCSPPTNDVLKNRKKRFNAALKKCADNDDVCISNTYSVFNQGPQKQAKCRLPENPREATPICTYICSKTGKSCSFAEFRAENPLKSS